MDTHRYLAFRAVHTRASRAGESHTRGHARYRTPVCMHIRHAVFVRSRVTYDDMRVCNVAMLRVRSCKASSSSRLVTGNAVLERVRAACQRDMQVPFVITFAPLHPDTLHQNESLQHARSILHSQMRDIAISVYTYICIF